MMNEELLQYIKQELEKGTTKEAITDLLLSQGWQVSDLDAIFQSLSISPKTNEVLDSNTSSNVNANQNSLQPPKKSHWKLILTSTISLLVILIAAFLLFPQLLKLVSRDNEIKNNSEISPNPTTASKDIPPIDDSDLSLKVITVPDNENAYFDLIKLENIVLKDDPTPDMLSGIKWDNKVVSEIVTRNLQAYGYFTDAASKPKFQRPEAANPANVTPNLVLTGLSSLRGMSRLSSLKAMYLAKQGKDKEAMEEALNSVIIGQKIEDSQLTLIEYLVAIAVKSIGLETIQRILVTSKLSSDDLKQYAQGLNQYYKNEDGLINSFKSEYQMQSWTINAMVNGNPEALAEYDSLNEDNLEFSKKIKDSFYFQPNKTKLLFAEVARSNIKRVNQSCGEIKESDIPILASTSSIEKFNEENIIGKIFHDTIALGLTSVILKKCDEDFLVASTEAMLAIKAYINDNGKYPDSLVKLVPTYLSSVLIDPYDGKDIKYSFAKKIIYSVGYDMQDSGGSTGVDWHAMADPTFVIKF